MTLTLSIAMPSFSSSMPKLLCWMRSQHACGDPTEITLSRRMAGSCAILLLPLLLPAAARSRDSS